MGNVVKFLMADGFELFAARLELFVDLDGLLGHLLVRAFGAAHQRKIRPGGEPFVAVGIQPDAQQDCPAFFLLRCVRHQSKLSALAIAVKAATVALCGM
jgi:hypothetical protein